MGMTRWQVTPSPRNDAPITREYLIQVFDYCPATGIFTWKYREDATKRWNTRYAGKQAGTVTNHGKYIHIFLNGRPYPAHRLAWLYIHGEWPKPLIDHIDGNGLNCRRYNLRLASHTDNMRNRQCQSNSRTGLKGVIHCPKNGKNPFYAHISVNRKRVFLGFYKTPEEAHQAYVEASLKYHGEFARTA